MENLTETKFFIEVKKPLIGDSHSFLNKGVYDLVEFRKRIPFIRVDDDEDNEWFKVHSVSVLKYGTRIVFKGHKYYIIQAVYPTKKGSYSYSGSSALADVATNLLGRVYPFYYIAPSVDAKQKDWLQVAENDFYIALKYWFINSEGKVCVGFVGEKPDADEWRKKTNNYFTSYAKATEALLKMTERM